MKPRQKQIFIAILILVVIAFGIFVYYKNSKKQISKNVVPVPVLPKLSAIRNLKLGSVDKSGPSAFIEETYLKNTFVIQAVTNNVPLPADGHFYRLWLYNNDKQSVAVGVMKLSSKGVYTLTYQTPIDLRYYSHVVITSDTNLGTTKGDTVLDGMFE